MSKSVESEDDLFEQARRAFEAGDLATAGYLFSRVVELKGGRRNAAEQYLVEITRRRTQTGSTREAASRGD